MNKAGFRYKCRRCGCEFQLKWDCGYDPYKAMSDAVALASRETPSLDDGVAGVSIEFPRLIGGHKCEPIECNGVVGQGIADLIGYDEDGGK